MITFTPTSDTIHFYAALDNILARIGSPSVGELSEVSAAIRQGFAENFAAEAVGDIAPWDPLSPRTVLERIQAGFPGEHPILVRTGSYRASFIDRNASDHVEEVTATGSGFVLDVGSEDDRAEVLEFGSGKVPERPVTILSDEAEAGVFAAYDRWLAARLFG